ncbi:hypothetical protein ACE7GA_11645 [Roseomonas sp. CCTCC AB2023176]|uniref:hypothetical protein n=1 Tax=Roseomonas sp. CCTCC AB2023176 TaxID=3342640 RepID=UPI0035D70CB6
MMRRGPDAIPAPPATGAAAHPGPGRTAARPMRRPRAITLVLVSGAVLTLGACDSQQERCRRARAEGRPDAEAVCAGRSGSSGTSSSWFGWSGSNGSTATSGTATTSTRGGFGSTASSHGSSGG